MHTRQQQRRNVSEFDALIASPAVGAVVMPANARIAFRNQSGAAAGTTAGTIVGASTRTILTPALRGDQLTRPEYAEADSTVTPAAGFELLVDIGLGRFRRIAGASSVAEVFQRNKAAGLWIDPLAGQTVYADTAGTTQAVPDGAVARMDSVGGVAAQFTNATAGQQPLLRADGLEFDGTDDQLSYPDDPALRFGTTSFTVAIAVRPDVVTGQHGIFSKRGTGAAGTNPGWGLRQSGAAVALEYDYLGSASAPPYILAAGVLTVATWTTVLVEMDVGSGQATARINGVAQTPVAITPGDISGTRPLAYGAESTGIYYTDGKLGRAIAIDKLLSEADKTTVESWITAGYQ